MLRIRGAYRTEGISKFLSKYDKEEFIKKRIGEAIGPEVVHAVGYKEETIPAPTVDFSETFKFSTDFYVMSREEALELINYVQVLASSSDALLCSAGENIKRILK